MGKLDDPELQINYPSADYPFPMPEPAPGKYWSSLKSQAFLKISDQDTANKNILKDIFDLGSKDCQARRAKKKFGLMISKCIFWRPEYSNIMADINNYNTKYSTYGYMGRGMSDAILNTKNDPSLWRMVDNGLTPEDCTTEFDQRSQMFSASSYFDSSLGVGKGVLVKRNVITLVSCSGQTMKTSGSENIRLNYGVVAGRSKSLLIMAKDFKLINQVVNTSRQHLPFN